MNKSKSISKYKGYKGYKGIKSNDTTEIKKINIGIQLLRTICSFLVVVCHFYNFQHYRIIYNKHIYYLITFFYISFYFSYNTLASRNISKIKERFIRMLIPYIGWPLLFYLKDKLNHYYYKRRDIYKLKNLYYQIIVGCKIYGIFWFLFNLIFLTLFFTLIIFMFKKYYMYALFISCIIIYSFFYSNYANILIFYKYKKVPCHHSIRPNLEYFVFTFTGFYLASIRFIHKLYKYRYISIICSMISLYVYIKYYTPFFRKVTFFYKGIIRDILVTFFFIIFSMLPFDKINNNYIYTFLNKITSYTGGIYYIHVKAGEISENYIYLIRIRSFKGCVILYLICYSTCFLGAFILKKFHFKYLFM